MNLHDYKSTTLVRTRIIGLLSTTGEEKVLVNKFDNVASLLKEDIVTTEELRDHIAHELCKSEVFSILADSRAVMIHHRHFAAIEVHVNVVPSEH